MNTDAKAAAKPEPEAEPELSPVTKLVVAVVAVALTAYLLCWPVPIDPVAWTPPSLDPWPVNERLATLTFHSVEAFGEGPEDVAVDSEGRLYGGLKNGTIVRVTGGKAEAFASTGEGGRVLGLDFAADGTLWACDANKGLFRVSPSGEATQVVTHHGGQRLGFCNDVDVGPNGVVYFSDASWKFGVDQFREDIMEHGPNGRLFSLDPETGKLTQLLDGLCFANGVAVDAEGRFVLVNELGKYRIWRTWLTGPKAGTHDVLIENLPGFPDGISRGSDGVFWVALANPRNEMLDALLPFPFARTVVARLPEALQPAEVRHAFLLGINADGEVVHDLQHPDPAPFAPVTSVEEHEGVLYLGSLSGTRFASTPAPR